MSFSCRRARCSYCAALDRHSRISHTIPVSPIEQAPHCFLPRLRHIQVPARDTTHSPLLSWNRYSTTQNRPMSITTFFNLTTSVRVSKNFYLKCDLLLISQAGTTFHYHAPILLTEAAMVPDMWGSHHKAYYTSTSHYKVNIITVLQTRARGTDNSPLIIRPVYVALSTVDWTGYIPLFQSHLIPGMAFLRQANSSQLHCTMSFPSAPTLTRSSSCW
jgi:hypothetical protein